MIINTYPDIDLVIIGSLCTFFPVIWYLIIYSIDIKWITPKEFIDGPLDNTCTFIRGNPDKRILRLPFCFQSLSQGFL
jgi:hypothetical protein